MSGFHFISNSGILFSRPVRARGGDLSFGKIKIEIKINCLGRPGCRLALLSRHNIDH